MGRLEGKRKQLLVWGLGALAFLLLIFVFYFFRRSGKRKLVQARLQELQSLKIQKSESLSSAYSEIQTTLQQVQQQTNDLEIQQIRIEDSIHYALRIQNAILPRQEILNQLLPDAYLLYRSREIISGDLYWWERHGKYLFIAVVDGAGHGVPGAFAGAAIFQLLDNTVQQNANETPEAILMLLDAELHHRNHGQSDDDREETFDIALIRIDLSDGKLLYSGAYRPILHVSEGKANELPCIRRSIGGEENTHRPFTQHSLQLKKGDRIALFTDGVTRQLGGNRRRAFTRNRLYRILNPAANPSKKTSNSLSRQGDLLHIELERWQGREKQLDDWLLLAIEW